MPSARQTATGVPVRLDAVGVGNAIMDALVRLDDDAVLDHLGVARGRMTPVDHRRWHEVYERVRGFGVDVAAGGSCANTISALGFLGASVSYRGRVANDDFGEAYWRSMTEACGRHHVEIALDGFTGKCLSLISRHDGERTMLTDLGIAGTLGEVGEFASAIASAQVLHLEGYAFLGGPIREAAFSAIAAAEAAGVPISFDCSDPFVARTVRDDVEALIKDHADIAFLNREEAEILTGLGAHAAIDAMREWASVVVVKLGAEGSLVAANGQVVHAPAFPTSVLDTTGAGDAYAGGFLYGHLQGWSPAKCGELGSRVASLTVGQVGAVVRDRARLAEVRSLVERG